MRGLKSGSFATSTPLYKINKRASKRNSMKNASELYLKKFEKDYTSIDATELETIIKQETKEKSDKIDLNLFYEMIEYASEIPYEDEDEHLNKNWEKSINSYLKKFYPKEKYYYLFPNERASEQRG